MHAAPHQKFQRDWTTQSPYKGKMLILAPDERTLQIHAHPLQQLWAGMFTRYTSIS